MLSLAQNRSYRTLHLVASVFSMWRLPSCVVEEADTDGFGIVLRVGEQKDVMPEGHWLLDGCWMSPEEQDPDSFSRNLDEFLLRDSFCITKEVPTLEDANLFCDGEQILPQEKQDDVAPLTTVRTFTRRERGSYLEMLLDNATPDTERWMGTVLAHFLVQRAVPGAANTRELIPPPLSVSAEQVEDVRRQDRKDAADKVQCAENSMIEAEEALFKVISRQSSSREFIEPLMCNYTLAKQLLEQDTGGLPSASAQAQVLTHHVVLQCDSLVDRDAIKAVQRADRDCRDVLVIRLRIFCEDPLDRDLFISNAAKAYIGPGAEIDALDKDILSQLLLSYHVLRRNRELGFRSKGQEAVDRRAGTLRMKQPGQQTQTQGDEVKASPQLRVGEPGVPAPLPIKVEQWMENCSDIRLQLAFNDKALLKAKARQDNTDTALLNPGGDEVEVPVNSQTIPIGQGPNKMGGHHASTLAEASTVTTGKHPWELPNQYRNCRRPEPMGNGTYRLSNGKCYTDYKLAAAELRELKWYHHLHGFHPRNRGSCADLMVNVD